MVAAKVRNPGVTYRGKGWFIQIWGTGGKRVYSETLPGPNTKAAEAAATKRRDYLLNRKALGLSLRERDGGTESFGDVADRWLASLQLPPHTIAGYWNQLNTYWMPHFANWGINEITTPIIKEHLAAFGVKIKTQKNTLIPLRGVLDHGGVNPNPARGIKWPKRERERQRTVVTRYKPKQRDKVIQALDDIAAKAGREAHENPSQRSRSRAHWTAQAALYFPLLFAIGTRPGETLGLDWWDWDEGQFIAIETQRSGGREKDTTKTGHRRKVYLPEWIRPRLAAHNTRFNRGAIFLGQRGEALKDTKRLNPIWKEAHELARVPLLGDPYTCRHTRAAELLSRGVSPAEAAAQLGHSVQMFLEIYSEFIQEYAEHQDFSRLESIAPALRPSKQLFSVEAIG